MTFDFVPLARLREIWWHASLAGFALRHDMESCATKTTADLSLASRGRICVYDLVLGCTSAIISLFTYAY